MLGLAAAGKAGNASPAVAREVVGLETGREGGADEPLEEEVAAQGGAWLDDPPPLARALGASIEGKDLPFATLLPQLPCLLTALLLDCAVELFSFKTRLPPLPATAAEEPGRTPVGPGERGSLR